MSSAAPSTFLLAFSSASPGGRRRARVGSSPPFRRGGSLNLRFWAPPRTPWRAAVVRAEEDVVGKEAAAPELTADDARQQTRARRGGAGNAVAKLKEPVQPVGRYGADEESAPTPAPRNETQNGALVGDDDESIVTTPVLSIVKFPPPGSGVLLPSGDVAPGTTVPTTTPAPLPPSSASSFASPPYVPKFDTADNVEFADNSAAKVVDDVPAPKAPSPPAPEAQEALWDFKTYIGFDEPADAKDDAGAAADGAGSFENFQDNDSGPLAGGLGDVMGSLPKALARRGHRVMVVVPRYGDYAEAQDLGIRKYYKAAGQDLEVNYFHAYIDGVDFVFIDAPLFRHRQDDIYGGNRQEILKRMILFCKVAVEVPWHVPCGGVPYGDGNLVFIANDWHTALLPVYLKAYYRDNGLMQYARSVLVIHNIAHQGRGPVAEYPYMDLPEHYLQHFELYDPVGGEHANIFAAGLKMADRVVTVSRGYLWELKTVEGGWGLHDIVRSNDWKINGIVNGIDHQEWNPEVDVHLRSDGYTNYSLSTLDSGKRQCKAALQRELGLAVRDDVPLLGFIGRLDGQKGVDIIGDAMPWLAGQDVQLVMLGSGRGDLERMLEHLEQTHHDKVRGWVGFSVPMAHRITAGADVLVMPSRFEPCGLNQLYAMAYGTVPVVHAVGGLRDTVTPFDPFADAGLGWTFDRAEANKLIEALGHCLDTYRNYGESWRRLQERGMSQDLSWDHAAQLYEEVLVKAKYQW
ncbi:hypothetical protein EJB05_45544 [Eragrostis curvula]|uniref:starch synthase n=1 Tax=Eragrostis curvula TaxID=38414 RepID=A0A5J9TKJ5_9POAL|nr:hypothetical protein EJB05_45544 [Eragrostis curvula]